MAGIPYRALTIDDFTPSDSGPWQTKFNYDDQMPHVMPAFGPKHVLSFDCWCHPVRDEEYTEAVISHNVAQ